MNTMHTAAIGPVTVGPDDLAGWTERTCWRYKIAQLWARYMPRAKGWFPRQMGSRLGRGVRNLTRTAGGAKLAMDPRNWDIYCAIGNARGTWDAPVLDASCRFLKPGDIFYDIGANVGFMAIEASNRYADQISVVAFEPQPGLARLIAVSAALNGFKNLKTFAVMLGKDPGEGDLFVPSHSIHASAVSRSSNAQVLHCPKTTIDQMLAQNLIPAPTVIKIDVEGAEWDVFRGAAQTISTHRPAIIFESDCNTARFGYGRRELCAYLRELGDYEFFAVQPDGIQRMENLMEDESVRDMAAVPAGRL